MRKLSVLNRTNDPISIQCNHPNQHAQSSCVILPAASTSIDVSRTRSHLTLSSHAGEKWTAYDEKASIDVNTFQVRFPLAFGAQWKVVKVDEECPWRIYRSKVSVRVS